MDVLTHMLTCANCEEIKRPRYVVFSSILGDPCTANLGKCRSLIENHWPHLLQAPKKAGGTGGRGGGLQESQLPSKQACKLMQLKWRLLGI